MLEKGQSKTAEDLEAKNEKQKKRRQNQSGQLVLEYILLMLLAVSMAAIMKSQLIGGSAGQKCDEAPVLSGLVCSLTMAIAADTPGE